MSDVSVWVFACVWGWFVGVWEGEEIMRTLRAIVKLFLTNDLHFEFVSEFSQFRGGMRPRRQYLLIDSGQIMPRARARNVEVEISRCATTPPVETYCRHIPNIARAHPSVLQGWRQDAHESLAAQMALAMRATRAWPTGSSGQTFEAQATQAAQVA